MYICIYTYIYICHRTAPEQAESSHAISRASSSLKHTATRCNTLHYTATRCNTAPEQAESSHAISRVPPLALRPVVRMIQDK